MQQIQAIELMSFIQEAQAAGDKVIILIDGNTDMKKSDLVTAFHSLNLA